MDVSGYGRANPQRRARRRVDAARATTPRASGQSGRPPVRGSDFGAATGDAFDAGAPATPASAWASSSTTPPLTPWSRSSLTPSATATDLPPAVLALPSPAITHDLSGVPSRMQTVWPTVTDISWLSADADPRFEAIAEVYLAELTPMDRSSGRAGR